ncbi:PAS domain-containing protein [Sphingomonas sp. ERG5]|uniref:PAS domain-containing protein n=1 Tax=Sphingomonas sp. ERG5 TaxID=1381597 RepID=UPI00054C7486|nr:PAS domain-containing protein [Sphingomonas sp. ERG5]
MTAPAQVIPLDPPRDHIVTASDLVRHFGVWQERAIRSPVYILHRGRPRLILTSIDVMDALCAPHAVGAGGNDMGSTALLDSVDDMVILADQDLRVTAASRSARSYFGTAVDPGHPIDAVGPDAARQFLAEAIHRVAASGLAETLDLPSIRYHNRSLAIAIQPHPGGVALFVHDVTIASDLREAEAERHATSETIAVIPGIASARINLRGYLDRPDAPLARLSGLSIDALSSVRFVTLLDIASRVGVAEAVEAVIAGGPSRSIAATLLVNRGEPTPVQIGLAALRRGAAIEAVSAMIVSRLSG